MARCAGSRTERSALLSVAAPSQTADDCQVTRRLRVLVIMPSQAASSVSHARPTVSAYIASKSTRGSRSGKSTCWVGSSRGWAEPAQRPGEARRGVVGHAGQAGAGAGLRPQSCRLWSRQPARLMEGEPRWPDRRDLHGEVTAASINHSTSQPHGLFSVSDYTGDGCGDRRLRKEDAWTVVVFSWALLEPLRPPL